MKPPALIRDPAELRERLGRLTFDLRTLDLSGFRRWLRMLTDRWAKDPVFAQRSQIRDVRRAHPELQTLEAEHRRATAADAESEHGSRLREFDRSVYETGKAIRGLDDALTRAEPDRRPSLEAKREAFAARLRALEAEQDELVRSSPERQELLRATAALDRFRAAIGLDREEARLAQLQTTRGRGSGRAGTAFEDEALNLTRSIILPEWAPDPIGVHILRTVRLGAAGVELDQVVVCRTGGPDEPVEVLAVVEVKRNINDLAHGFRRRQIDLAWLTADRSAYDPAGYRTGVFDAGHFDRPAAHWQDGQPFVFVPASFGRFVRDPETGHFLNGLVLVSRSGPIRGLSGAAIAQVATSVSTDERWDPDNEAYLGRLFEWARSLTHSVESPEIIRLYTANAERAGQLLVPGLESFPSSASL
jgi:hypothetical protein